MRKELDINVRIDPEELAYELSRKMSYDELLDLFREVDNQVADWDFTEMVIAWTDEEKKDHEELRQS